jgi:hypothetical protein
MLIRNDGYHATRWGAGITDLSGDGVGVTDIFQTRGRGFGDGDTGTARAAMQPQHRPNQWGSSVKYARGNGYGCWPGYRTGEGDSFIGDIGYEEC